MRITNALQKKLPRPEASPGRFEVWSARASLETVHATAAEAMHSADTYHGEFGETFYVIDTHQADAESQVFFCTREGGA